LVALRSRRRLGRAISRKVRRIGVFVPGSVQTHGQYVTAFRNELNTLRYAEGTDYVLLVRWGEGSLDRFSDYARELATAVKGQTSIIPVIFVRVADPSVSGFVKSLAE
jgi:putative tryptophan/tyrosine transport system substrate-binding protein